MGLKDVLTGVPPLARAIRAAKVRLFPGSQAYWEQRYAKGGTSGPGSYDIYADFKATTLNRIVSDNEIDSVIELGCGDGNQLSLAEYPRYLGLDVSGSAIDLCIHRFAGDESKSFMLYEPERFINQGWLVADMSISLDVILHLVEDDIFERYMETLFGIGRKLVVIFGEDVGDQRPHSTDRYRDWPAWVREHHPDWTLSERIDNPHKGENTLADFFVFRPA